MSSPRLLPRLRSPAVTKQLQLSPQAVPAISRRLSAVNTTASPQPLPPVSFTSSPIFRQPSDYGKDHPSPDERTLKLGNTLRTLQPLLPTLLQTPLPTSILSPQITLHLFPSTHPHLPVVHGRVAYIAALWTSPLAWGRVPLIGNVRLEILSERMVRGSGSGSPLYYASAASASGYRSEQLVVKWRTEGKARAKIATEITRVVDAGSGKKGKYDDEFTGLFVFEFDEEGRIVRHVIEHVQEGGNWERGVGAKVVGLTDWLLGGMKDGGEPTPGCV